MKNLSPIDHHSHESSSLKHLISGTVAGVLEYSFFYPLDTAKTRMQDLSKNEKNVYNSVWKTIIHMYRTEGMSSLFRGVTIFAGGSGPAHGMYFVTYEYFKEHLNKYFEKNIAYGISGAMATVAHDGFMVPCETVKQRRQMLNSPYKSDIDCIIRMYQNEGIRSFYQSYTTQLVMNIPFQSIHFIVYEWASRAISSGNDFHPLEHATSGAIAGAFAAFITNPLDVCKTLLNTQKNEKVVGVWNAIKEVYSLAGPLGFFRGATARVIHIMPSTGVCWATYETMKHILGKLFDM